MRHYSSKNRSWDLSKTIEHVLPWKETNKTVIQIWCLCIGICIMWLCTLQTSSTQCMYMCMCKCSSICITNWIDIYTMFQIHLLRIRNNLILQFASHTNVKSAQQIMAKDWARCEDQRFFLCAQYSRTIKQTSGQTNWCITSNIITQVPPLQAALFRESFFFSSPPPRCPSVGRHL